MLRITDQYIWNFVFTVFFAAVITMGAIILDSEAYRPYSELVLTDYIILALATYRLIRLFVADTITKWFREQFWDTKESKGQMLLVKPSSGPRRTVADLLSCPWCFGAWAAMMVIFFYLLTPWAQFPVLILAIAGAGTWMQQAAALTGWKAEQAKGDVERFQ